MAGAGLRCRHDRHRAARGRSCDPGRTSDDQPNPERLEVNRLYQPAHFREDRIEVQHDISIARIEGKWKVSQNRSEADRLGVARGLREQGDAHEPMSVLVAERGAAAPSGPRVDP